MTEENKILNLDEIFGNARAVKVKWQGKEYGLLRIEALGLRMISEFQSMQKKAFNLQKQSLDKEISDEQENEISQLFNQMLKILCPSLPINDMPFVAKARVVEFYITEMKGKNSLDIAPKKGKRGKQTGAMSSQG